MPRRNDISKILILSLAFALPSTLRGQTNDAAELAKTGHPPSFTCRSVQLLAQSGSPLASAAVNISVLRMHFMRPHVSAVAMEFKSVKVTKTNLRGEFKLPNLSPGSYQLKLDRAAKNRFGAFEIPPRWQPKNCTEPWVLEDRGE